MNAKLVPYLMSEDARGQAEFYKKVLSGEILTIKTYGEAPGTPEELKDRVMHMVLSLAGENTLFFSDIFEPVEGNRSTSLSLTFENETEARQAFAELGEGGEIRYPFELQPWGACYGEILDRFGVTWQFATTI
ncbi:VOC family protein [Paenibacillus motobuensis]|uniref:VOC family protein n=1 Tax=Paenibacillus TaxID=44249 RepID=UPI00203E1758|nr:MULTISPECIES: VOC family protein [Paenibacillus]MCM3040092.1 VOC family protein [Paenibacillus lutimineralis]MCM3647196.1 VOC family protein [Paenibacillus motobuensis]